ncbi:hypothetical protein LTR85_000252 [Meristemomyces frigidus]|nr:hypothetical protein LTR85_000252 [Meristemomyces frigidus]
MASALGAFAQLPRELRDLIYVLATDPTYIEADIHSVCETPDPLHDVSQALRNESSDAIGKQKGQPCKHTKFSFTLPPLSVPNESITRHGKFDMKAVGYHHKVSNTKALRFLTGHMGKDVPLAIVFTFQLPERATYAIYGASAWTEKALYEVVNTFVDINIQNAQNFAFGPRTWLRAKDIEDLAVAVRMAVCRADEDDNFGYAGEKPWELM